MRHSVKVKVCPQLKGLGLIALVWVLLLGWVMMGSTTLAQTPRPTLTFVPSPTSTPDPTPTVPPETQPQAPAPSGYTGPTLRGLVLNLSTGQPESGMSVVFASGGVSVEVVSGENGEYAFDHLGTANGLLNVVPPQQSGLVPIAVDVAVQSKAGVETVVNLGVSPDKSATPPIIPVVQLSPDYVDAGDVMTITVTIKNAFPQSISGATVTNWLPERVVPVSIHSSTGNPYFSDNLAIAELGTLDAGSGALIEIVAQATGGRVSSASLQGKVSFFYRENAAAQSLSRTSSAAPTVLPVTGLGIPVIGLGLVLIVFIVGWVRRRVGRASPAS